MEKVKVNRIYLSKLENENMLLREENKRLKQIFLSDCESYNLSLLQKSMRIETLEREVNVLKRKNNMLLLLKNQ